MGALAKDRHKQIEKITFLKITFRVVKNDSSLCLMVDADYLLERQTEAELLLSFPRWPT